MTTIELILCFMLMSTNVQGHFNYLKLFTPKYFYKTSSIKEVEREYYYKPTISGQHSTTSSELNRKYYYKPVDHSKSSYEEKYAESLTTKHELVDSFIDSMIDPLPSSKYEVQLSVNKPSYTQNINDFTQENIGQGYLDSSSSQTEEATVPISATYDTKPSNPSTTSIPLADEDEISSNVVAYLVTDPENPQTDFLISKATLLQSGTIFNKVVNFSSWTANAGGQVKILNEKSFRLSGLWYDESGPAKWIVGREFPIRLDDDAVVLGELSQSSDLVLPNELSVTDIGWLALYCESCEEDRKLIMQVYIPETFL